MTHTDPRQLLVLHRSPLLRGVSLAAIEALLASIPVVRCASDANLFERGEPAEEAFLILEGRCEVALTTAPGREQRRRILEPGEFVGELGLFTGGRRTATARAVEPLVMLRLTREQLLELLRAWPEVALALLRTLSERLVEAEGP
jgi:CRP-like cAMP-binding protein